MGDGIPVDKIRNLSVRKTIFLYMAAALFCSFLLSDVIVRIAERTQILRAPLSVLKGYQEMLTEYLPGEDIDMGQAMEMLSESGHQIERMDAFVEAMRKLKSLENRQLTPGNIFARQLEKDIQGELAILKKECGKQ